MVHRLFGQVSTEDQRDSLDRDICKRVSISILRIRFNSMYVAPFLTRWSFVRLCRQLALARPCAINRPAATAIFSLCVSGQRFMYWNRLGRVLCSRGRWRYLYLRARFQA